jgi:hypothetical protein
MTARRRRRKQRRRESRRARRSEKKQKTVLHRWARDLSSSQGRTRKEER